MENPDILGVYSDERHLAVVLYRGTQMVFREIYAITKTEYALLGDFQSRCRFIKDRLYKILDKHVPDTSKINLVAAGSGPLKKSPTGVFSLNAQTISRIESKEFGENVSHCGLVAAWDFASRYSIPLVLSSPPSSDDFPVRARVSHTPETVRDVAHSQIPGSVILNLFYASRKAGREKFPALSIVALNLDITSCTAAIKNGKLVDMAIENRGMDMHQLRKLLKAQIASTITLKDAETRARKGDALAQAVIDAYGYQHVKAAWSMAGALDGRVDMFVITGLNASAVSIEQKLIPYLEQIAPVHRVTGFDTATAAALTALDAFMEGSITDDVF